jgi:signal transduction histidine kinase
MQAVILHKQLVLTRQWVADQDVRLFDNPGSATNQKADTAPKAEHGGEFYKQISPSVLTKILSERAQAKEDFSFRITNLEPMNPDNRADEFEQLALSRFRSGNREGVFQKQDVEGRTTLRYVAPIEVNKSCIECHKEQGFRTGEVGGCLSLFIPMTEAEKAIRRNRAVLLIGGLLFGGSLTGLLYMSAQRLFLRRIRDLKSGFSKLSSDPSGALSHVAGDELREIENLCSELDQRLADQHRDLERKVVDATKDLTAANRRLERTNQQLETLNRAKTDFLTDISHELRTPLTNIKGAVDFLARKDACSDPQYLDIIRRNSEHLIKMVVDFLDYSRIESGQLELHLEPGCIGEVIKEACDSLTGEAQKKNVEITLDVFDECEVVFDKLRIYQVMLNLLSNAVKFSPDAGIIRVSLEKRNNGCRVSVQDEGPGIDPAFHKAIFEKFYQIGNGADLRSVGSAGIGLAICRGIVLSHKGDIGIESTPGHGSTFYFKIPGI